ncbi:MAG: lactonase family protein [Gemmataceae bacterium]|nr:lactonase family protein [Gemmataceae bacterium]
MRCLLALLLLPFLALAAFAQDSAMPKTWRVYVGTYTGPKSKGIYLYDFDAESAKLTEQGLVGELPNPTFLTIHPSGKHLYAVSEVSGFKGTKAGGVAAFKIDPATGKLSLLNQQTSGGPGPCHISLDRTSKHALVANYGGGSVESLPIADDGALGEPTTFIQHKGSSANKGRQGEPHAHSINVDPTNRFAMAADLGIDKVLVYAFDAKTGKLSSHEPESAKVAPGAGPRHFAFHPDGKHAFVINELLLTMTSFKYDSEKGTLTEIDTLSTLPKDAKRVGASTAEVVVHPNGKFVFGSNRGHNSITTFKFENGKLSWVANQASDINTPRNFVLDPTGKFLLVGNQGGNSITVFRVDQNTGELTQVGEPTTGVSAPVCLRFTPKP